VFIAALTLLFTTAFDWYSTVREDEARRIQQQSQPEEGQPSGQIQSEVQRAAAALAESKERNAWQVDETIDRVILICLLVTSALGVLAFASATSRREAVRAEPESAPAG
jgi:hypothetical protein